MAADFDVLSRAKALGETGAAFRFCTQYKNSCRSDPSSVHCAAEVDSPFPRLLEGHFLWPFQCRRPPRENILHNGSYTLCDGVHLCGAFAGKRSDILWNPIY
jgi:hypothetical protein